jgi:hypothetical protein
MEEWGVDRWLGIAGVVIGVLGIVIGVAVAYYFYLKSIRTKRLAYACTVGVPITIGPHVTGSNVERFLLLWNRGTAPIVGSDFVKPISVESPIELWNISVHSKDAASSVEGDMHARQIRVNLLRPNEAVILVLSALEKSELNLSIEMMSDDMSEYIDGTYLFLPQSITTIMALLIVFFGSFIYLLQAYFGPPRLCHLSLGL